MPSRRRPIRLPALALALLATLVSACAGAAALETSPAGVSQPVPLEVAVAEAAALREAGAFVLDVREPDEWRAGHIPGATLIPLGQLPARVAEVPRGRTVVVVCRSGNRSAQGRDVLRAGGIDGATSMAGGVSAWGSAGLPLVAGD